MHFIDYLEIKSNVKSLERTCDKEPLKYGPCVL